MYFGVRTLSPLLLALVGTCASGCVVSKAKYDEAVLRADDQAQQAADLKRQLADLQQRADATTSELEQLRAAWQQSQGELEQTQVDVNTKDANLAELSYEHEQKVREHKETSAMVEQLRDELARIASHMAELSEQRDTLNEEKDKLAAQLETLDAQAKSARQRALVVRDLSLALQEPLKKESVRLDLREDRILVWTRSSTLFSKDGSKLTSDGKSFLANMGKALSASESVVAVEERGPIEKAGVRASRMRVIGEQFTKAGLSLGRVTLEIPKGGEAQSDDSKGKSPQIIFTVKNASNAEHALADVGTSTSRL